MPMYPTPRAAPVSLHHNELNANSATYNALKSQTCSHRSLPNQKRRNGPNASFLFQKKTDAFGFVWPTEITIPSAGGNFISFLDRPIVSTHLEDRQHFPHLTSTAIIGNHKSTKMTKLKPALHPIKSRGDLGKRLLVWRMLSEHLNEPWM